MSGGSVLSRIVAGPFAPARMVAPRLEGGAVLPAPQVPAPVVARALEGAVSDVERADGEPSRTVEPGPSSSRPHVSHSPRGRAPPPRPEEPTACVAPAPVSGRPGARRARLGDMPLVVRERRDEHLQEVTPWREPLVAASSSEERHDRPPRPESFSPAGAPERTPPLAHAPRQSKEFPREGAPSRQSAARTLDVGPRGGLPEEGEGSPRAGVPALTAPLAPGKPMPLCLKPAQPAGDAGRTDKTDPGAFERSPMAVSRPEPSVPPVSQPSLLSRRAPLLVAPTSESWRGGAVRSVRPTAREVPLTRAPLVAPLVTAPTSEARRDRSVPLETFTPAAMRARHPVKEPPREQTRSKQSVAGAPGSGPRGASAGVQGRTSPVLASPRTATGSPVAPGSPSLAPAGRPAQPPSQGEPKRPAETSSKAKAAAMMPRKGTPAPVPGRSSPAPAARSPNGRQPTVAITISSLEIRDRHAPVAQPLASVSPRAHEIDPGLPFGSSASGRW
jgi:hypothetical protein